jgi:hypothetical protein
MVVESSLTLFFYSCGLVFDFRLGVGSDKLSSSVTGNALINTYPANVENTVSS